MSTITGSIGCGRAVTGRVTVTGRVSGAELPGSALISGMDLGLMAAPCVALLGAELAPKRGCGNGTRDYRPYAAPAMRSSIETNTARHGRRKPQ
jgi:hypothetical protein